MNIFSLLVRAGIDSGEVLRLVQALGKSADLRKCRPGETFTINHRADGSVVSVVYHKSPLEVFSVKRQPDSWQVTREKIPVETRVVRMAGRVSSSLFSAMDDLGASDALAVALMDILSWEIDFAHETKPNDSFALVVEKQFVENREVGAGRILAARYVSASGRVVEGFSIPEGTRTAYYNAKGQSLRTSFLRTPLRFTRISSGYTSRRLHPVTGVVQPHYAVDYAAPSGTPVWSVADGTVKRASFDNAAGRMVVVNHPGGYETYYLHLSGFARGVRAGTRVRQQQVIGYVGSTGLATGPHLDFRMRRNGSYVNPLRESFPRSEPVPPARRPEFDRRVAWLAPILEGSVAPDLAAAHP